MRKIYTFFVFITVIFLSSFGYCDNNDSSQLQQDIKKELQTLNQNMEELSEWKLNEKTKDQIQTVAQETYEKSNKYVEKLQNLAQMSLVEKEKSINNWVNTVILIVAVFTLLVLVIEAFSIFKIKKRYDEETKKLKLTIQEIMVDTDKTIKEEIHSNQLRMENQINNAKKELQNERKKAEIKLQEHSYDMEYQKGIRLLNLKRLENALEIFSYLSFHYGKRKIDLSLHIGQCLIGLNRIEEAEKSIQEAMQKAKDEKNETLYRSATSLYKKLINIKNVVNRDKSLNSKR